MTRDDAFALLPCRGGDLPLPGRLWGRGNGDPARSAIEDDRIGDYLSGANVLRFFASTMLAVLPGFPGAQHGRKAARA